MNTKSQHYLWIILASSSLTVMAGSIISPILNLMREGLGVDPSYARIIITTHGLFIAICSPLIGLLIDKVGVKRPFALGLLIYGLAGGAGLVITDYWVLIISRIILGIGVAAIITPITVIILDLYEGARRNRVMGWRASGNNVGGIIWPLLGGFLGTFSWHMPFATYLIGVPLAFLVFLFIPETHKYQSQSTNTKDKEFSLLRLFKSTPILFIPYSLTFLTHILLYSIVVFVPQLLQQLGIENPFYIGIFISTVTLTGALMSLIYGRIREKFSYKAIVIVSLALWVAGFAIMSQALSSFVVGISMVLFGTGMGIISPAVMVWAGESVPAPFRGRATSYLATFAFIGQFLSPIILSPIASSFGLNSVFLAESGACALLFVLFLVFLRQEASGRLVDSASE